MPTADLDWIIEKQYFKWEGNLHSMIFDDITTACPECIGYIRASLYYGNSNISEYASLSTKGRSRIQPNKIRQRNKWFDSGIYNKTPSPVGRQHLEQHLKNYLVDHRKINFVPSKHYNLHAKTDSNNWLIKTIHLGLISLYYRIGNCGEHADLALSWFYTNAPAGWTIYRVFLGNFSASYKNECFNLYCRKDGKDYVGYHSNSNTIYDADNDDDYEKVTYDHAFLIVRDDLGNIAICDPWSAYFGYLVRPEFNNYNYLKDFMKLVYYRGWDAGPGERDYLAWLEEVFHNDILSRDARTNYPLPLINTNGIFIDTNYRSDRSLVWDKEKGKFDDSNLRNFEIPLKYSNGRRVKTNNWGFQDEDVSLTLEKFIMKPSILTVELTGNSTQRRLALGKIGNDLCNGTVFNEPSNYF